MLCVFSLGDSKETHMVTEEMDLTTTGAAPEGGGLLVSTPSFMVTAEPPAAAVFWCR